MSDVFFVVVVCLTTGLLLYAYDLVKDRSRLAEVSILLVAIVLLGQSFFAPEVVKLKVKYWMMIISGLGAIWIALSMCARKIKSRGVK